MKSLVLMSLVVLSTTSVFGSSTDTINVPSIADQNKIIVDKIAIYYQSCHTKVNKKVVGSVLKAIDKYLPRYFSDGEFTKQDFIALAMLESNFRQYEVGTSGEVGIFQIMKIHIPDSVENPFEIYINTKMAMKWMHHTYHKHKDYKKAIIAYNGIVKLKKQKGAWNERYWDVFQIRKKLLTEMQVE
jgi:hypothetical protein